MSEKISPISPITSVNELKYNKKEPDHQNKDKNPRDSESKENNNLPKEPGKGTFIDVKV